MTKFLRELITKDTPILKLQQNDIQEEEKIKILDLESNVSKLYITYMYYHNNKWYYFKKDGNNIGYQFCILDELMGSYLAKIRKLPTVSYEIAKVDRDYGLVSINFKQEGIKYYTLPQLIGTLISDDIENINILKSFTINLENEKEFLNHLFNLFALDIHMLQKDRGDVNLQFQINANNYFDIAPLYDYSNCSSKVISELFIPNRIVKINDYTVNLLLKKYPEFKESLELCLQQSMEEIWNQICLDYHFNQNCYSYEQIRSYYEIKDKSQKQYIKNILDDIKRY